MSLKQRLTEFGKELDSFLLSSERLTEEDFRLLRLSNLGVPPPINNNKKKKIEYPKTMKIQKFKTRFETIQDVLKYLKPLKLLIRNMLKIIYLFILYIYLYYICIFF